MCPPGVDQTQRSAQAWTIFAPSLQEQIPLRFASDDGWRRTVGPLNRLQSDWSFDAFDKLVSVQSAPLDTDTLSISNIGAAHGGSHIEMLPAELLCAITDDPILKPEDVVSLGLCSQKLWQQTSCHIYSSRAKGQGTWVGTELACLGSYLQDLPPSLGAMFPSVAEHEKTFHIRRYGKCPARRWEWEARRRYKDVTDANPKMLWLEAFDTHARAAGLPQRVLGELRAQLQDQVLQLPRSSPASRSHWVLRNLTKREVVRIKTVERQVGLDFAERVAVCVDGASRELTLDKALMLCLCWSQRPIHLPQESPQWIVGQGRWSGDCFDVVVGSEGGSGEGWSDVTAEIVGRWEYARQFRA